MERPISNEMMSSAIHAKNSVSVANLKLSFESCPEKRGFWEQTAHAFILSRAIEGKQKISILDAGCGAGEHVSDLVDESLFRGLDTHVWLADLIPGNLFTAKKKINKFLEKSPGKVHGHVVLGDIKESLPNDKFDLVLLWEVIHWESPSGVRRMFEVLSDHMNKNGLLMVSYATPLNNACLKTHNGKLNFRESYRRVPIYKKSESTNAWMSFFDRGSLQKIGLQSGLSPYAFEQLDNPFFPTRVGVLQYSFLRGRTSTENEMFAFRKL